MSSSRSPGNPGFKAGFELSLRALRWVALLGLAGCAGSVLAGSFSVSPVRVYMQARERAVAITVINEGDTELVMQAEVFDWKQKPGAVDDLTPTDDLVMAPPVLKLAPKSRQVLRLANLRPVMPGRQLTYRLLVRELPEALPPAPGAQIQVALAFSIPIFITPADARQQMGCSTVKRAKESVSVSCENVGSAYAQPVKLSLVDSSGQVELNEDVVGGYVLPDAARTFQMKLTGKTVSTGPAKLTVVFDDGSKQTFDVPLAD